MQKNHPSVIAPRLEALLIALRFYARPESYEIPPGGDDIADFPVLIDNGERARTALAQLGFLPRVDDKMEREPTSDQSQWPAHLRDDATFVTCRVCHRQSYALGDSGQPCAMIQPNGTICPGRFDQFVR